MKCLCCASKSKITNSRPFSNGFEKWRRHSCLKCGYTFTTRELPDLELSVRVVKRSGQTEPFFINKLMVSIYRSLDHRVNSQVDAGAVAQSICLSMLPLPEAMISTEQIATYTINSLKNFDPAGAVKYQAALTPQMNRRDVRRAIS